MSFNICSEFGAFITVSHFTCFSSSSSFSSFSLFSALHCFAVKVLPVALVHSFSFGILFETVREIKCVKELKALKELNALKELS